MTSKTAAPTVFMPLANHQHHGVGCHISGRRSSSSFRRCDLLHPVCGRE
jgi:hypothetical protein